MASGSHKRSVAFAGTSNQLAVDAKGSVFFEKIGGGFHRMAEGGEGKAAFSAGCLGAAI